MYANICCLGIGFFGGGGGGQERFRSLGSAAYFDNLSLSSSGSDYESLVRM